MENYGRKIIDDIFSKRSNSSADVLGLTKEDKYSMVMNKCFIIKKQIAFK